ncbi:helix-turn-helix transcriptional regulator [Lactiplantibacillus plantarum]|uniref:winged helix-turn-helix transcriptional regulator n=1 Tax=Lactiplantibacillus plantarum TaxID=1590 RepID=UPI0023496E85|nr:helix-turn-helix domain-containing protein [Lactiplantibacillus plantarum]MCG0820324.1 putative transcription regulator (putative) [Lactiplantibacillus plantarum]MCG0879805.1 putative transcription regulator (putative) [Lactiplantibacillus plantarum]WCL68184.1 helix-turn-helix transcriptional regulator [Lactiplantibacillus plantarum]
MRTITPIENSRRHEEFCPLDTTLSILSGKWKSIIICRLMGNSQRFSSLLKGMPGCTNRMLAMQLKELVADQIVSQRTVATHSVYGLTAVGLSLVPIIKAMDRWGKAYLETLQLA